MLDMHLFSTLRLPAHVTVPDGALNHTGVQIDHYELLLRSRKTETFASQMVPLREEAATVQFELESCPVEGYLAECDRSRLFQEWGYRNRSAEHPAWRAGLAAAGEVLVVMAIFLFFYG